MNREKITKLKWEKPRIVNKMAFNKTAAGPSGTRTDGTIGGLVS